MDALKLELDFDATRKGIRDQLFGLLSASQVEAITAQVQAMAESDAHFHDVGAVEAAINAADIPESVKQDACGIYQVLAQAEAQVHGCAVEETHFHEVGNSEAVANVLSVCLAVAALEPGEIVATPIQTGQGKVRCAHGLLDIPAPATAAIIARGIPVVDVKRDGEWCTPTSAAIIYHFVDRFE